VRSERRANRRILAERTLAEIWGEGMPALPEHVATRLRLPAEITAKMEREFILGDYVRTVIHRAQRTGDKLSCPSAGRFIARCCLALVHIGPGITTLPAAQARVNAESSTWSRERNEP
jgi:hypothetical protein